MLPLIILLADAAQNIPIGSAQRARSKPARLVSTDQGRVYPRRGDFPADCGCWTRCAVPPNKTKLTGPRPPTQTRKKARTRGSGWTRSWASRYTTFRMSRFGQKRTAF